MFWYYLAAKKRRTACHRKKSTISRSIGRCSIHDRGPPRVLCLTIVIFLFMCIGYACISHHGHHIWIPFIVIYLRYHESPCLALNSPRTASIYHAVRNHLSFTEQSYIWDIRLWGSFLRARTPEKDFRLFLWIPGPRSGPDWTLLAVQRKQWISSHGSTHLPCTAFRFHRGRFRKHSPIVFHKTQRLAQHTIYRETW